MSNRAQQNNASSSDADRRRRHTIGATPILAAATFGVSTGGIVYTHRLLAPISQAILNQNSGSSSTVSSHVNAPPILQQNLLQPSTIQSRNEEWETKTLRQTFSRIAEKRILLLLSSAYFGGAELWAAHLAFKFSPHANSVHFVAVEPSSSTSRLHRHLNKIFGGTRFSVSLNCITRTDSQRYVQENQISTIIKNRNGADVLTIAAA